MPLFLNVFTLLLLGYAWVREWCLSIKRTLAGEGQHLVIEGLRRKIEEERRIHSIASEGYVEQIAKLRNALKLKEEESKRALEAEICRAGTLHEGLTNTEAQIRERDSVIEWKEASLAIMTKKYEEAQAHLNTVSGDLKDAEVFLSLADLVPDEEVKSIVRRLNDEIFQVAGYVSGEPSVTYDDGQAELDSTPGLSILPESPLLSVFHSINPDLLSSVVETSLQSAMSVYAMGLAMSWDLGVPGNNGQDLTEVYRMMRARERYSIAARWRILTRTHLRSFLRRQVEDFTQDLINVVVDTLIACKAEGSRETLTGIVTREYETELRKIVNISLQFQKISGEQVVSRDFSLFTASAGSVFDSHCMEDSGVYFGTPPPSSSSERRVLCTTGLGLMEESPASRRHHDDFTLKTRVLLKPQVVLRAVNDGDRVPDEVRGRSRRCSEEAIGKGCVGDTVVDLGIDVQDQIAESAQAGNNDPQGRNRMMPEGPSHHTSMEQDSHDGERFDGVAGALGEDIESPS